MLFEMMCSRLLAHCSYVLGCEAEIHAMRAVFDSPNAEGVLQVDASNVLIV